MSLMYMLPLNNCLVLRALNTLILSSEAYYWKCLVLSCQLQKNKRKIPLL